MNTQIALAEPTAPELLPLGKLQLAALRQSDDIVFRHTNGASRIEAIKRCKPTATDPFAPTERTILIPVAFGFTDYSNFPEHVREHYRAGAAFNAFAMTGNSHFHEEMFTITQLLAVGDTLTLHWIRGAFNSPSLTAHGMTGDRLNLIVERGGRIKKMVFRIEDHLAEPGSISRMIKRTGYAIA